MYCDYATNLSDIFNIGEKVLHITQNERTIGTNKESQLFCLGKTEFVNAC